MKRILFAIPIPYGHEWGFWTRDSGLVVLELRKMGYDALLVALADRAKITPGHPVLPVTLEEMKNPDWWKSQQPDAVVLSTWSAPRYDAIRKAALAATPLVVERMDTSGNRSVRLFPRACFVQMWGGYWDRLPRSARWLALPLTVAKIAILYAFPRLLDARMAASMIKTPAVIAESPIAADRIKQIIETYTGGSHPVIMIPHPVNESVIHYDGAPKQNRIISVGRWGSAQKDFPLLVKVLQGFLDRHPDWQATVVGGGVPAQYRVGGANPEEWRKRVVFHENLTHEKLAVEYGRSKVYVMVSRYESFCIAAAEALCCGCSVVGSVDVPSSGLFAQHESGLVSPARTRKAFLVTLDQEVGHWTEGKRNPAAIAATFGGKVGVRAVAEATVKLLEELSPLGPSARSTQRLEAS